MSDVYDNMCTCRERGLTSQNACQIYFLSKPRFSNWSHDSKTVLGIENIENKSVQIVNYVCLTSHSLFKSGMGLSPMVTTNALN